MTNKTVKDLMLSLAEYGVVDKKATLAQALEILDGAQQHLPPGRHPHRAVFVRDESGRIVGKLGHLAFLRALLPEAQTWNSEALMDRAGVSPDMLSISEGAFEFLADEMLDVEEKARHVLVGDVFNPTSATIHADATLTEAIRVFLNHNLLSLMVTQDDKTVGVLRLADLFDEIAEEVRGNRGKTEEAGD